MNFTWRFRRNGRGRAGKIEALKGLNFEVELVIPTHFRCPISLDLMKDPVTLATGNTYDRESIEKWLENGNVKCPVTNQILGNFDLIPNHSLRKMIQDWCVENKSYGVERIPTPRIPITPYEVFDICSRMAAATRLKDVKKCLALLSKIVNLAKENERNKHCIVNNGIGSSLANSFEFFASFPGDGHETILTEILSALTWAFPMDQPGVSKLKSAASLRCMARFLSGEDLSSKQNAVFVVKELIFADHDSLKGVLEIEGIEETLFRIIEVQFCPRATKECLVVIHHMMLLEENSATVTMRFVKMGLIPLILELLVDGDKSTCGKALSILDIICNFKEGREIVRKNALAIPILVKKILRVSDPATECCISSLWSLCFEERDENALLEAVQLGAFQKLLVVLQVGCCVGRKEKVTELLKLMNLYRDKLDCFDSSMGFKYVKRSI